jgi:uncharacterized protein YbaR (Trm112 family)
MKCSSEMSRRELPPLLIACPHCQHPSLIRIKRSSSSSNGLWTDGYANSNVFDTCGVSICPSCNEVFVEAQAERLAMPEKISAKPAIEIDAQRLFDALERGIADSAGQEIGLRTRIWWAGNHIKRGLERSTTNLRLIVRGFGDVEDPNTWEPWPAIPESIRIENMKALLPLLESQPNEKRHVVPEAELLRELGRFDEAVVRVSEAYWGGAAAAVLVHNKAREGSSEVCLVCEQRDMPMVIF